MGNYKVEKPDLQFDEASRADGIDLNLIVAELNKLVDAHNKVANKILDLEEEIESLKEELAKLKGQVFNVNSELKEPRTKFSLLSAVSSVPEERRCLDLKIRFFGGDRYHECSFIGSSLSDWTNLEMWSDTVSNIIDGGEW